MNSSRHVTASGFFALDVILDADGHMVSADPGGSAGNVLAFLNAMGWTAAPVVSLGADAASSVVIDTWSRAGFDLSYVLRSPSGTPIPIVFQHGNQEGHRFSFSCPTCGISYAPGDSYGSTRPRPSRTDVFFLDRATPQTVELAQYYANENATIVFEPSAIGDEALFRKAVELSDIVKYSGERLSPHAVRADGAAVEICTRGSGGLTFRAGSSESREWIAVGGYQLPAIKDAAGAGDWCTAGIIHWLLREPADLRHVTYDKLWGALMFGQALASLNCMAVGARGLLRQNLFGQALWLAEQLVTLRLRETSAHSESNVLAEASSLLGDDSHRFSEMPQLCCDWNRPF
jgi:fructokinase